MTVRGTRWVGAGITVCAALVLLAAHAIVVPTPVRAAECCQVCEAKEAACYATCESMSHEDGETDSLGACYTACQDELYHPTHGCWTHCVYCGQPPSPRSCYSYTVFHETVCVYWVLGLCVQTETYHWTYVQEVDFGNCTS